MSPKVKLAFGGGVAFMVLVMVVFLATRPPPPPPVDLKLVAAEKKMDAARTAVREGRYEDAVKSIEEGESLFAGIDATHLADNARLELSAQRGIAEAQSLMAQERFDDARAVLGKVSTKAVKGSEAAKKVLTELDTAEVAFKKARIEELLAAGEVDEAKELVVQLPPTESSELSARILEFEAELAAQLAADQQQDHANAVASSRAAKARREEAIGLAFAVVERKFAGGEWERAASECDRVVDANSGDREIQTRARELKRLIPNFGRNYDEGKKKYRQKSLTTAARPLRNAHQIYQQMKLTSNPFGRELEEMLAQASVVAGKEALLRNDIASAARYFKDATRLDPQDTQARDGLEKVIGQAEDLYQEAYMIRDRDPREALRKFKIVVEVTPVGSTTHEKAKNQVAAMQP
jgi:tetratricopeptide (TPR) repeat protein